MALGSIEELVGNFALFHDWEERYRYLIDLGRTLPHMDDARKTDAHLVRGCTSRVWMIMHVKDGTLNFEADSDAHIVRGLIVLLFVAYQGQKLDDILNIDIDKMFKDIGLDQHLSPNRRSGFYAMVERVKGMVHS